MSLQVYYTLSSSSKDAHVSELQPGSSYDGDDISKIYQALRSRYAEQACSELPSLFEHYGPCFRGETYKRTKSRILSAWTVPSCTELWSRHFCELCHYLCHGTSKDKVLLQLMPIAEDGKVSCKVVLFSWCQTDHPVLKKAKYQL